MPILHKYLQLAIGVYAVKNIFPTSHVQGSLTSIISHCQKVTKNIPRAFIHQTQKVLFPLSCKRITHLPILNLHCHPWWWNSTRLFFSLDLIYLKISHDYPCLSKQTAEPYLKRLMKMEVVLQEKEQFIQEKNYFHISIYSIGATGSTYDHILEKNPQTLKKPLK